MAKVFGKLQVGRLLGVAFGLLGIVSISWAQTATLLPNALQSFTDNNGKPLANGNVYFYVPSTTTPKITWTTSSESGPVQPNPVPLGISGRPASPIFGDGSYRQIVQDQFGNVIWDFTTASTGGGSGPTPPLTSVGDGNAVGTVIAWSNTSIPSQYMVAAGQAISRTTYSVLFGTITLSAQGNCIAGSLTITNLASTEVIPLGAPVESNCTIPGATVVSKTPTTVNLSVPATLSTTSTLQFFPWGNGDAATTFNVPDLRGRAIAASDSMGGMVAGTLTSQFFGMSPDGMGAYGGSQFHQQLLSELVQHSHPNVIVDPGHAHGYQEPGASFSAGGSGTPVSQVRSNGVTDTAFTGISIDNATAGGNQPFPTIPPMATLYYIIKVLPNNFANVASIAELTPGTPNQLAGTNGSGIWGNVTVPLGLMVSGNALNFNIPALTQKVSPDANNDYVIVYDAAGSATKKATVGSIAASATAGVASLGGATGALTLDQCLSIAGGSTLSGSGNCIINPKAAAFKAAGSNTATTSNATFTSGTNTLTLVSAIDFANGQGIRVNHAGAAFAANPASSVGCTASGTTGATVYAYTVVALDANGGVGVAPTQCQINNGNATLTSVNKNTVTWALPGSSSPVAYAIYVKVGAGAYHATAIVGNTITSFVDTNAGNINPPDWLPALPNFSTSFADWLVTIITSGQTTTSLVLGANAGSTVLSGTGVFHDDTAALQAAITAAQTGGFGQIHVPAGSYSISSTLHITSHVLFDGAGYQAVAFGATDPTNNGFTSTTLICLPSVSTTACLQVSATDSVQLQNFGIRYPSQAFPGTFGMSLGAGGGTNTNNFSSVHNVVVYNADTGVISNNWYNALYDNLNVIAYNNTGMNLRESHFPSTSDSTITNSLFSGGVGLYHIVVQSGGGWKFTTNKFNDSIGAAICFCLIHEPASDAGGGYFLEPLLVQNNSIEASPTAFLFNNSDTVNNATSAENVVITGNQVNTSGGTMIDFVARTVSGPITTPQWIDGAIISGNFLGFTFSSLAGIFVDGAQDLTITSNMILVSTGQIAIQYGTNNTAGSIQQSGNFMRAGGVTGITNVVVPGSPACNSTYINTNPYNVNINLYGGTNVTGVVVQPLATGTPQTIYGTSTTTIPLPPVNVVLNPSDEIEVQCAGGGAFPNWQWAAINP